MHEPLACPHCGKQFSWHTKYAGKTVRCSNCQQPFQIPQSQLSASASTHATADKRSSAGGTSIGPEIGLDLPDASSEAKLRLQHTDRLSFWQLFDFRFEHYLTPYIIRFYWMCALAVAAIMVAAFLVDSVIALGTNNEGSGRATAEAEVEALFDYKLPGRSQNKYSVRSFIMRVVWQCRIVPIVVFGLTSMRLACEFGIVAFNISNSLKVIEQRMRRRRE